MIQKRRIIFPLVLLVFATIACKKDPRSTLGINLQPADESLQPLYNDTLKALELQCYTAKDDSLLIKNASYYQLGSIKDRIFGVTTCNIITQVFPYSDSPQPTDVSSIDSVRIYMDYSYFTSNGVSYAQSNPKVQSGDVLDPFEVDVYELNEIYEMGDSLYSNRAPQYKPAVLLPSQTIVPQPFDTISYLSDHSAPMLVIKLPNEIGERIANMTADQYQYVDYFTEVLAGFYFKVKPETSNNKGAVVTLNIGGNNTRMVIFYKKNGSDETYSSQLAIKTGLFSIVNYNEIIHDYTNAEVELKKQLEGETSYGERALYFQAAAGTVGKINLPFIKELRKENIIINQARLVFTIDDDSYSDRKFEQTQGLVIFYKDSTGANQQLLDQYTGVGGVIEGNEYSFYITRYVQQMLYYDSDNYELTVAPSFRAYNSDAVKVYGTDPALGKQKKARLELIYTKIP